MDFPLNPNLWCLRTSIIMPKENEEGRREKIQLAASTFRLDARAAAIVMRTVHNVVDTGMTVVCTINQPSIDIFESFDELLLQKGEEMLFILVLLGGVPSPLSNTSKKLRGLPRIDPEHNQAALNMNARSYFRKFGESTWS